MESRDFFAAACFLFGAAMVILRLRFRPAPRKRATAPAIGRGHIRVTGRSAAETRRIIADFARLYGLEPATFAVAEATEGLQVRWTGPIPSDIALFLVNYLHDPADERPGNSRAQIAGVIPVPAALAPQGVTADTLAKIFVPEGQAEGDLVHALTPDGRAFRISFTRMTWEPVGAAAASDWVQRLAFTTEGQ